ncbi:helix-turn-helix transcriptional regulator [Francisellaceae bacterium]|nr:helix-turn-helix transcriptional regulator [Francisellaceae bacterium]
MDFIYEYFQVYIFKIMHKDILICENFDMPSNKTIKELKHPPESPYQHFVSDKAHYFCHTVLVGNNNRIIIILKLHSNIDAINATSLAYRVSNILLQNADKFTFIPSNSFTTCDNKNQKLSLLMEEIIIDHFPFTKEKLSSPDLVYIRLIAANCTSDVISEIIGRSVRTVEDKINRIYKKLKCKSRRELIELCNYVTLEYINKSLINPSRNFSTI